MSAFPTLADTHPGGFVVIPACYTESGLPVTDGNFSGVWNNVPVLWEQLEDIHEKLTLMTHTLVLGSWISGGVVNAHTHPVQGSSQSWSSAKAAAESQYEATEPVAADGIPPTIHSRAQWSDAYGRNQYLASLSTVKSRYRVTGLTGEGAVRFYNYAVAAVPYGNGTVTSRIWDNAFGVEGVTENCWTAWSQTGASGGIAVSDFLGGLVESPVLNPGQWCAMPDPGYNNRTARGFDVMYAVALVEQAGLHRDFPAVDGQRSARGRLGRSGRQLRMLGVVRDPPRWGMEITGMRSRCPF